MTKSTIRWGILSTARIAETAFIPALRQIEGGEVVAVASRDGERATAFAQKHGIPQAYGDYASLLENDQIDAIYNPLPNTLHPEWTKAAADQGKHIFCEKPLAVTAVEAEEMVAYCEQAGVLLFEAFVFLYHPQSRRLRQLLDEGVIGELRQLQAHCTFHLQRPSANIRLSKELGGGGLLDAGCYPITFARFAFDGEPTQIQSTCRMDPEYGVDARVAMLLTFSGDRYATLQTGLDAQGGQGALLMGSAGHIEIPRPYHPQAQSAFDVHTASGVERITFDTGTLPFAPALTHFQACIRGEAEPLFTAANAAGSLRIIEAVLAAA